MLKSVICTVVVATVLLGASSLPARAQTSAKDVVEKGSETGEAIRDYAVERKDEAIAHARKLAGDLDARIKELEGQAGKEVGEAKAKSKRMIKDLKAKRTKVSRKLRDLSKASKASWDEAKNGFADAYRDLAVAYDKAVAEIKK